MLALAMIVGVFTPLIASAAEEKVSTDKNAKTKTVTLHKLMMDKEVLKAWDSDKVEKSEKADGTKDGYDATQNLEELKQITELKKIMGQKEIKEADGVYFAWQREFEEDDPASTTNPKAKIKVWRYIDKDGNKATVQNPEDANFKTAVLGGLTANKEGYKFTTESLPNGAYKIQEIKELSNYKSTDGKTIVDQKAVPVEITLPLVNEDGTVIDAHVYPKNTEDKPQIDKNFAKDNTLTDVTENFKDKFTEIEEKNADDTNNINEGPKYDNYQKKKKVAQAEVGKIIPYEVKTKIAAGTSYENLTWNDIMTNGLTYNQDLGTSKTYTKQDDGLDLTTGIKVESITRDKSEKEIGRTTIEILASDYELIQDDNGFRLKMNKTGLEKIDKVTKATEAKDVEITLTYSATVNGTAEVDEPEKNNITLEYGHKPGKDHKEKPVTPSNEELKVTKNFEQGANTEGLKIVYTLRNGNDVVATVALDNTITNKTINLGNGITFEVGETAFNGTFKGLDKTKTSNWTFSERVAGYNPEYAKTNADGTVTITNKKDNDNPTPLNPTEPRVVVGGKKFVKTTDKAADQVQANDRLAGAKFVVKNADGTKYLAVKSVDTVQSEKEKLTKAKEALDTAVKNYNERKDDTNKETLAKAIGTAQTNYNNAFKTAGTRYEWVAKDAKNVTLVTLASNKDGQFEIEGLAYGKYKLEEIEAPKGYAKRNDVDFEIAKGDTTDVEIKYTTTDKANNAKQVINKTVTIPQTGGIGTIIFTAIGLAIMASAVIAIKKRQAAEAR